MIRQEDPAELRAAQLRAQQADFRWSYRHARPALGDRMVICYGVYKGHVAVLDDDRPGWETVGLLSGCSGNRYYRTDLRPLGQYDQLMVLDFKE